MADPVEALWQHVEQEPSDERVRLSGLKNWANAFGSARGACSPKKVRLPRL
jgi:hypothetical protein